MRQFYGNYEGYPATIETLPAARISFTHKCEPIEILARPVGLGLGFDRWAIVLYRTRVADMRLECIGDVTIFNDPDLGKGEFRLEVDVPGDPDLARPILVLLSRAVECGEIEKVMLNEPITLGKD